MESNEVLNIRINSVSESASTAKDPEVCPSTIIVQEESQTMKESDDSP